MNQVNYKPEKNHFTKIYEKLELLGILNLIENKVNDAKSTTEGDLDLKYNFVCAKGATKKIILSQRYISRNCVHAEPEMGVIIYSHGAAEASYYKNTAPPKNILINTELKDYTLKSKLKVNTYLIVWLESLLRRGHSFK